MATRPIGYWLKEVDRLLDRTFEHALASEQCTRRHWQVLNTLEPGPMRELEIEEAMAPFVATDPQAAQAALEDLEQRGWTRSGPGGIELTEEGREIHRRLHATVAAHRRHVAEGVTEEAYRTTVDVLERMAGNLERFLEHEKTAPPRAAPVRTGRPPG